MEKKASEIQKTASNNSDKVTLNDENYSQLIQGINTLKEEIDVLKKENKSLKGLLINYAPNMKDVINDLINRVKKLEKTMHTIVITDDNQPNPSQNAETTDANAMDASMRFFQHALSGLGHGRGAIIGEIIGGILRGTGSITIDFGNKK